MREPFGDSGKAAAEEHHFHARSRKEEVKRGNERGQVRPGGCQLGVNQSRRCQQAHAPITILLPPVRRQHGGTRAAPYAAIAR